MKLKNVRSSADKTFCFWGREKRGGRVRKIIFVLMVVGGISMAFLSRPIRCAAKTQQSLPEEEIPEDMKELVKRFKAFYKKELKEDFPQDTRYVRNFLNQSLTMNRDLSRMLKMEIAGALCRSM